MRLAAGSPDVIRMRWAGKSGDPATVQRSILYPYSHTNFSPLQLHLLYDEILNHPSTSDDLRRLTESKAPPAQAAAPAILPVTGEDSKIKKQLSRK